MIYIYISMPFGMIFSSCICEKRCFSRISDETRQFFGVVLELARPSEARCFPPAGDFFEAVLLQRPQATEAVEKGLGFQKRQNLQKLEKRCFSRIRSHVREFFGAVSWLLRPSLHGVWGWRMEGGSFELISSLICYRISLGSELARPSEACFPPGRWFFQAVLLQQPQATEARKTLFF